MRALAVDEKRPELPPLRPGEIRKALGDTRNVIGLLGLRWASLMKRAVFARRK